MLGQEVRETPDQSADFVGQLKHGLQNLRGALTELHGSVGADPTTPQEIARRFGINKNLTWKISKIINTNDVLASAQHIPGSAGIEIFLKAFETGGAPHAAIERVRSAVEEFDRLVELHTGDRATLELVLGSMLPERREVSRKLAFQGNSATWGIQAKVRLSTNIEAPSPDGNGLIDSAVITGMIDLRRLRPDARWPLLRVQSYNDNGTLIEAAHEPLDPAAAELAGPPLMLDFSSVPPEEIEAVPTQGGVQYDLRAGAIGNTGAVSCVIGYSSRNFASIYRDEANRYGEHPVSLLTPVEMVICDLILHEALPLELPPDVGLYSRLSGALTYPCAAHQRERLPLRETIHELGSGPPIVATPYVPRYPQMVQAACERLGWDLREFKGYRFTMRYPPIPTTAVLRYELPEAP